MSERPDPTLVNQMSGPGATVAGSIGTVNNYLNGQPVPYLPKDNLALAGIVPNPRFVGREDELTRLRAALDAGDVNVTQAVRGEGGIGKSELAKTFLFRYREDYGAVWWIDASPAGFGQSVRDLLTVLRIAAPVDASEETLCGLVRHAWADGRIHLVVLDNVETDREYRLLRPPSPCRTLLTTRFALEPEHTAEFMLDVLSPADALDLLRGRRSDLSTPADVVALGELAEEVGRHTQALALLAASLARYGGAPADLLFRLRAQAVGSDAHLFGEILQSHAHPDYALSVEASLSLHWDRLKHHAARSLLDFCAFVHPENIPVSLLAQAAGLTSARL